MKKPRRTGRKRKQKVTMPNVAMIDVDNPLYQNSHAESSTNPKTIKAAYNAKESYAGYLFVQGKISRAEKKAADKVRQAFERMGGAGAQAIDYSKEPVDGGLTVDPITLAELEAGETLRSVHRALGPQGHDLVLKLAGEGLWPRDIATGERRRYVSMRFRECLEHLAGHFGYARNKIVAMRA